MGSFRIIIMTLVLAGGLWTAVPEVAAQAVDLQEEAILLGDETAVALAPQQQGAISFLTILRMILVLALAAGAIYGILFFLKRISRTPEQKDPHLKVLAGVHLGSNRFVHVVSLGSQAWLLGACEGGVSLIAELTDTETIDAMLLDESRKSAQGKVSGFDFSQVLRRLGGGAGPDPHTELKAENVRKRRERLRGL